MSEESEQKQAQRECLFKEYEALKAEQNSRIGFRDNLLYVTIGAVGATAAVAMGVTSQTGVRQPDAFLLIPWITIILGWTYIANDLKITQIRRYIQKEVRSGLEALDIEKPFGWEVAHGVGTARKLLQLLVDLITFVFSGGAAIVADIVLAETAKTSYPVWLLGLWVFEALVLLVMAGVIINDFRSAVRGRAAKTTVNEERSTQPPPPEQPAGGSPKPPTV